MMTLYAHLGWDHGYLYIGQTGNLRERTWQHRRSARWWSEVAQVVILDRQPHPQSNAAERRLIQLHQPIYNYVWTDRWRRERTSWLKSQPWDGLYAGAHEVALMLGLSRQRVHQLVQQGDFPEPFEVLAAGKVWLTEDVQRWDDERKRVNRRAPQA